MQNDTCQDSKGSQYSPYNPLKFNIPIDPRRKCKGCGESKGQNFNEKPRKIYSTKHGGKQKQIKENPQLSQSLKVSSSESSLNFLQDRREDKGRENRILRYQGHDGTSFGAHLLRKSRPLIASGLTEKLKFKRDSDAGNIVTQNRRKVTQPPFIDEVDSDDFLHFRELQTDSNNPLCPQSFQSSLKKNFFNNQYLTTSNRAKEGLKFVMATNFPRLPSNPPSSTDSQPPRHEIKDVCGRKSHHPKLRARDLGKRLCEAPSMTKELDTLFKEYQQRCPEGNDQTEACHFLHHAPSPHHREPRRSILKDQRASMPEMNARKSSAFHAHLVRFDKEVDLMSTAMTKVNGIEASLRDTDGRLKLLRHADKRVIGPDQDLGKLDEEVTERYPLHVRCPKKTAQLQLGEQLELTKQADQEYLEDKTAKQDLARIYFTQEATKLMACANLPALNRDTNVFTKIDMLKKPSFPRFFMDRLMDETEAQMKRKQQDKVIAVKNEMDAFDESVKDRKDTFSNFDPSSQVPNEKSLNDLKLKMEIMKQQRERDVQRAAERNRTRKSYFRQMLPCFPDLIRNDLMEYSLKRACKLSGEEMMLASDLLAVARQKQGIEERHRKYGEQEELLSEEEEGMHRESERIVREILDVCIDVVVKIGNYKEATGRNPPESLKQEWRDVGFSFLNQLDASTSGQTEQGTDAVCGAEGSSEEDSGSTKSHRISELSNASTGGGNDASTSGKSDGDENSTRCVVTINTIKEQASGRASTEGKTVTSVQVQVTDCLHEDLESALTYDGLYLPMSGSQLTNSSSETTQTRTSGTLSKSPTDSPGDSAAECTLGIDKVAETAKGRMSAFEYEEYQGEHEEYFDENGQPVIPVIGVVSRDGTSNVIRVDGELTEETEMDEGVQRVGEVDVQDLDHSEDSPDGKKNKGLHFSDVVDKRSPYYADDGSVIGKSSGGDSKVSLKENIKFALPSDFESKRKPVLRKPTTFQPKASVDYNMDDDDDVDKEDILEYDERSESALSLRGEDFFGEEEEEEVNEEEDNEGETGTGSSKGVISHKAVAACTGPSKRKILVYGELGNITYGMYSVEHEKKFLQHRIKELMEYSETWGKGLNKPSSVLTLKEKISVPFSSQFPRKRLPPFNILDTYIPRPKFSLRMKKLIKMAEQAKLIKEKCTENVQLDDIPEKTEVSNVTPPVKQTCSEMIKGKSRIRPKWQDEIAEYECRRKEREKLMEAQLEDDYAKKLGFDAFYNASFKQTFTKPSAHVRVQTWDEKSSEQDMSSEGIRRTKTQACVPGADGNLPEVCMVEDDDDEGEEELDYDNMLCNHEGEECVILNRRYLELSGEGMEEEEFLEYPTATEDTIIPERTYSLQDFYNE